MVQSQLWVKFWWSGQSHISLEISLYNSPVVPILSSSAQVFWAPKSTSIALKFTIFYWTPPSLLHGIPDCLSDSTVSPILLQQQLFMQHLTAHLNLYSSFCLQWAANIRTKFTPYQSIILVGDVHSFVKVNKKSANQTGHLLGLKNRIK